MKKIIYLCVLTVLISGCATPDLVKYFNVPEGKCSYIPSYSWYCVFCNNHIVEYTSEPAGAKIEINGDIVGTTPYRELYNGQYSIKDDNRYFVVTVYPTKPGEYTQTKTIDKQKLPSTVYFDMNLAPSQNIDINYR